MPLHEQISRNACRSLSIFNWGNWFYHESHINIIKTCIKVERRGMRESPCWSSEPAGLYPLCLNRGNKLNNGSNKALILPLPLQSHFDIKMWVLFSKSDVLKVMLSASISQGQAERMKTEWFFRFYYQSDLNWFWNHMEGEDPKCFPRQIGVKISPQVVREKNTLHWAD